MIGWGESDVGIETGSYDAALHMAGIENYNVMLYTSVLPPEALELPHLPDIHHGSVLEGIMAVQHTDKPGTRITAGLLLAKVYRNAGGSYLGGFDGHCGIDVGIVPACAQHLLGSNRGRVHGHDEEDRVGQNRIEVKAYERDLFLHQASSCIAAVCYCDPSRHPGRAV